MHPSLASCEVLQKKFTPYLVVTPSAIFCVKRELDVRYILIVRDKTLFIGNLSHHMNDVKIYNQNIENIMINKNANRITRTLCSVNNNKNEGAMFL